MTATSNRPVWASQRRRESRDRTTPYTVCPKCGAHLDHNEACDCERFSRADITVDKYRRLNRENRALIDSMADTLYRLQASQK